jgi:hypothetical protein
LNRGVHYWKFDEIRHYLSRSRRVSVFLPATNDTARAVTSYEAGDEFIAPVSLDFTRCQCSDLATQDVREMKMNCPRAYHSNMIRATGSGVRSALWEIRRHPSRRNGSRIRQGLT